MKRMKTLLLLLTSVILLTTMLAGCSKSTNDPKPGSTAGTTTEQKPAPEGNDNAGGEKSSEVWKFGSSELAFTAYAHYGWMNFPKTMEDVPLWKYLKENKKVNITSILSNNNAAQVMATMMANDKLPDLIYGDRNHPDFLRLYKEGKLVPLDDYINKYPNLKKWLSSSAADLLRSPDGKLYQFPNWYTNRPSGSTAYVVNKKIYKELGSPALETMDQLYDYLVKVKEKYGDEIVPFDPDQAPNGQGIALLYTGFRENSHYRSFGNNTLGVVDEANNKLTSLFTDPAFRESQKFVSKLYREKLINQDMFTTDRGKVQERVMSGRAAIFAGSSLLAWASQADAILSKEDPDAGYFVTWPIHKAGLDKNKIFVNGYDQLGWNVSVITTAAKEPEKIFAFLDWMTGPEGMSTQYFGPEGEMWKGLDENEQPILTAAFDRAKAAEYEAANEPVMIAGNTAYIDPIKEKNEADKPVEERSWLLRYQQAVTWKTHLDQTALATNLIPESGSELANINTNVNDVFLQALSASATASSDADVDKILDQAQKDAEAVGYNELIEWRTQQWIKNKEILGEK